LSYWIKRNKVTIILSLILVFSAFLRVYKLNLDPPELFGDELDVGYQAYSILRTGRDIQGYFLPIYIHSLAEFRAPLFIYSATPFIKIFGLSEWGVRLTAAFWGILGVLMIYILTQKLFNNRMVSLFAAFFLAISPWHLQYSRAGFEVTLLLFLLIFAAWLFLKGFEKPVFFIPSAFLFALMPYTYSTAVVFMPLFILSLIIIFRQQLKSLWQTNSAKIAVLIFFLVLLPFGWQLLFGGASTRFSQINIAFHPEIVKKIVEARAIDQNSGVIFHNKVLSFLFEVSRNYLWAFSPQFLFTDGDPIGRHSVGEMGEFYWFQLLLIAVFLFWLLRGKVHLEKKSLIVLVVWLLLAPIPSSLTYQGANNATRLILLLPPLIIFCAVGVWLLYQNMKKTKFAWYLVFGILDVIALVNFVTYLHCYYVHYPLENWRAWQVGYKEAFAYIRESQDKYEKIIINNTYEPALIRFLFYMQYDPAKFHAEFTGEEAKKEIIVGIDGFKLDGKYYFGTLGGTARGLGSMAVFLSSTYLYLASAKDEIGEKPYLGVDAEQDVRVLKTITNYLGEPIFYLLTKR